MNQESKNQTTTPEEEQIVFCKRCGRPLKGFASKSLGFGPRCYNLWKKERNQQIQLFTPKESESNGS